MSNELVSPDDREKAFEYERQKALRLARFFTGIAGTKRTDWGISVGHAFQGLIEGRGLQTLSDEFEYYEELGRIKKDFRSSEASQMCFVELLKFLEQDIPDPQRLDLLKKIYIVAATEDKSDKNSPLPLQFMQIARSLNAGEILVLFTLRKLGGQEVKLRTELIKKLSHESGLQYDGLIELPYSKLVEMKLVHNIDEMSLAVTGKIILIRELIEPLGNAFCEYVEHYDSLKTEQEACTNPTRRELPRSRNL
jgi:hypothetical protein